VRRWWPALVSLVLYAILATAIYGFSNPWASNTRIPLCACNDEAQEVWFLAWPAFAVTHAHNLFFTWWVNVPSGQNLALNTTMPLLGIVGAPITWLIGPVATYNVLLRLAFVVSSLSLCLVLRRWTTWWPAAFVGGLLYGFSTYMVAEGEGHLFLTFVPLPPVILLVVDEIIARRRWPARRAGIVLGLLVVAEYLISPEVMTMTVILAGVAGVIVALARWRQVRAVLHHVVVAGLWAVGIAVVLLAYPVWMSVWGPEHLIGPQQGLAGLVGFAGDLWGPITPTHTQWITPRHLADVGTSFVGGSTAENGEYLGIPMVVAIVALTVAFRRRRRLVLATAMIVVSFVLSLGSHLVVDGHHTSIPLPFSLIIHVSLVQAILPVRFTLGMALFSGAVVGIGLDMTRAALVSPAFGTHSARSDQNGRGGALGWLASTGTLGMAALVAAPLIPAFPYPSVPTDVPALFTTSAVDRIPKDSVVLTYPYVLHPEVTAQLDQAVAAMRYRIVGSSGYIPGPDGRSFSGSQVLAPPQLQTLFYSAYSGTPADLASVLPLATTVPLIRTYLVRYRVSTVIFYDVGADPGIVRRYLTATLGPPTRVGGVTQWFDVPARLRSS
jgi:hypothetical protein